MKKVCIIGHPVKHSLSPKIHNYWLKEYGIKGIYEEPRDIHPEDFDNVFRSLHVDGYAGCNITIPFKERVFSSNLLDTLDKDYKFPIGRIAHWAKAVNTVVIKNGKYIGSNTDCFGFYDSIRNKYPDFSFGRGKVVILGAGGASRGIIQALIFANVPEVVILNRTPGKAEQIIKEINESTIRNKFTSLPWELRDRALKDANLLINTTSLGMVGQPALNINLKFLPKDALVTDIIYRPLITPLLQEARNRGNPIVDGLGMLLYQAVPGFEMWFSEELNGAKVEVTPDMRKKIESFL